MVDPVVKPRKLQSTAALTMALALFLLTRACLDPPSSQPQKNFLPSLLIGWGGAALEGHAETKSAPKSAPSSQFPLHKRERDAASLARAKRSPFSCYLASHPKNHCSQDELQVVLSRRRISLTFLLCRSHPRPCHIHQYPTDRRPLDALSVNLNRPDTISPIS